MSNIWLLKQVLQWRDQIKRLRAEGSASASYYNMSKLTGSSKKSQVSRTGTLFNYSQKERIFIDPHDYCQIVSLLDVSLMIGSDEYPWQSTFAVRENRECEDIAQPDIMIWILNCIIYSFINIVPCKLLPRWGLIQTRPDKFRCGIVDVSFTINKFWIFRTFTWGHICTILQAERILVPDFLVLCTLAQLAVCDTLR